MQDSMLGRAPTPNSHPFDPQRPWQLRELGQLIIQASCYVLLTKLHQWHQLEVMCQFQKHFRLASQE